MYTMKKNVHVILQSWNRLSIFGPSTRCLQKPGWSKRALHSRNLNSSFREERSTRNRAEFSLTDVNWDFTACMEDYNIFRVKSGFLYMFFHPTWFKYGWVWSVFHPTWFGLEIEVTFASERHEAAPNSQSKCKVRPRSKVHETMRGTTEDVLGPNHHWAGTVVLTVIRIIFLFLMNHDHERLGSD